MSTESCCIARPAARQLGRRRFVRLAGLGAGTALLLGLAPGRAGRGPAQPTSCC